MPMRYSVQQNGFVSLIVAAILMVLLSLVTIGFSQFVQREQRESLDRQLSTQAFYAAETGVNDVRTAIANGTLASVSACDSGLSGPLDNPSSSEPSGTIAITCVLVDDTPTTLSSQILENSLEILPIENSNGSAISSLTVTWNDPEGSGVVEATGCSSSNPASLSGVPCLLYTSPSPRDA